MAEPRYTMQKDLRRTGLTAHARRTLRRYKLWLDGIGMPADLHDELKHSALIHPLMTVFHGTGPGRWAQIKARYFKQGEGIRWHQLYGALDGARLLTYACRRRPPLREPPKLRSFLAEADRYGFASRALVCRPIRGQAPAARQVAQGLP